MQDFRKRRLGRGDLYRVLLGSGGVLLLALITFFAARGAWGMYQKFAEASAADDSSAKELASLQAEYAKVGAAVAELNSPQGVEAGVRERYGVAKPGEGEIDILRRAPTTTPEAVDSPNIFVKIFRALFVW